MNSFRATPAPSADSWRMVWSAIPAHSTSATRTRVELASWLNEHFALSEERRADVVLAVYEALANAVEAVAADEPVIELIATHRLDDATLTVTVANPGGGRSPERTTGTGPPVHRGHGIRLMQASADHVRID